MLESSLGQAKNLGHCLKLLMSATAIQLFMPLILSCSAHVDLLRAIERTVRRNPARTGVEDAKELDIGIAPAAYQWIPHIPHLETTTVSGLAS